MKTFNFRKAKKLKSFFQKGIMVMKKRGMYSGGKFVSWPKWKKGSF
jgi:hypothetical protein